MGWTLTVQWLGRQWSFGEVSASLTEEMSVFTGAPQVRSASFGVLWPRITDSVGAEISPAQAALTIEDLHGAPATLELDGELQLVGTVERPRFGSIGAVVEFSVREFDPEPNEDFPPAGEISTRRAENVVTTAGEAFNIPSTRNPVLEPVYNYVSNTTVTIGTIAERAEGMVYPVILGAPGGADSIPAYELPVVDNTALSETVLAAGHTKGGATFVRVYAETSAGIFYYTGENATLTNSVDNNGKTICTGDMTTFSQIDETNGSQAYYGSWAVAPLTQYADEVVELLGGACTRRIDWERMRSAYDVLRTYRIDGVIQEQVDPWEWLEDELWAILPGSVVVGPRGAYWVPWMPDAPAVGKLTAGREGVSLVDGGSLQYADTPVYNEIRIEYAGDAYRRGYRKAAVQDASTNAYSAISYARYGRRVETITSDYLYDDATASRLALARARLYALPPVLLELELSADRWGYLRAGDMVEITADTLGLSSERAQVARVTRRGTATNPVTLAIPREPM